MIASPENSKPRWLPTAALAIFAVAVIYSPLAWGAATNETRYWLDCGLAAAAGFYLVSLFVERRMPRISPILAGTLVFLGALGWTHALNPKFEYLWLNWQFRPLEDSFAFLPGTLDQKHTLEVVPHLSLMGLSMLALSDLTRRRRIKWSLLGMVVLSAFCVALIGIYQKATQADSMLWTDQVYPNRRVFFAAFRYHAHAAAFLNLCWPVALVLALRSFQRERPAYQRALWSNAFVFTFLAVFANTSKAGQGLALAGAVAALPLFWRELPFRSVSKRSLAIVGPLLIAVGVLAVLPSLGNSLGKWSDFVADPTSFKGRYFAYRGCVEMLGDSGWFGLGPGTFALAFPYYTAGLENQAPGFWDHAHQDYLQALIEWGYLGGGALILILLGGFVNAVGVRRLRRLLPTRRALGGQRDNSGRPLDLATKGSILALGMTAAHAMIDFPFQIPALQLLATIHLAILWRPTVADGSIHPF